MKRQKDKTLEDKHTQGVWCATGEEWGAITNSPRKNEEAGPKRKWSSVVDVSGGELKSLLMKVKEESEKVHSKLNFQKTMVMASSPITSWQIDGETMETVRAFILGGSKITTDGDCSHEIKRRLLLGRKAMTNLDSILKSRDITLATKVHLPKLWFSQ